MIKSMNDISFKKSLTPLYVYPKICKYTDRIDDVNTFLSPLISCDTPEDNELLLYFHIPFCKCLCTYCSYYKEILSKYSCNEIENLIECYIKEIKMYKKYNFFKNKKCKAIQIGGGTPTDIDTKLLVKLIDCVKEEFDTSECELIAIEGNAASLQDTKKIQILKKAGVSKISYGVQTFNENIRKKLNIKASIDDVYAASKNIKALGIEVAVDLMFNLPDQTEDQLIEDIEKCIDLDPDYIDIYGLNIFPNTKFKKILDSKQMFEEFPDDDRYIKAYKTLKKAFSDAGYQQSMVFTFTKPNVNASIYEKNFFSSNLLGIGPSSRSYLDGISFRNVSSISDYTEMINLGNVPIECGNYATDEEKEGRKVVFFPNLLECKKYSGIEKWNEEFDLLKEKGLIIDEGDKYVLTDEGCLWPGNISRLFFSEGQIEKHNVSFFKSVINKDNPYNQDKMGI